MAQATDTDLREVRELILSLERKREERFSSLEAALSQRITALEQSQQERNSRLVGWLGVFAIAVLALLTKIAFFSHHLLS